MRWFNRLPKCLSDSMNGIFLGVCSKKFFFRGLVALDADLRMFLVDYDRIQNKTPSYFSVFLNNSKISLLCVGTLSCTWLPPASRLLQTASFCFVSFIPTFPKLATNWCRGLWSVLLAGSSSRESWPSSVVPVCFSLSLNPLDCVASLNWVYSCECVC